MYRLDFSVCWTQTPHSKRDKDKGVKEFSLDIRRDISEILSPQRLPSSSNAPWAPEREYGFAKDISLRFIGGTGDELELVDYTIGPQSLMAMVTSCGGRSVEEFALTINEAPFGSRQCRRKIYEGTPIYSCYKS